MKQLKILFAVVIALVMTNLWAQEPDAAVLAGLEATVYKSPTCGCCTGYVEFLRKHGLEVRTVDTSDLPGIKAEFKVLSSVS
jgi:hypothetical protein